MTPMRPRGTPPDPHDGAKSTFAAFYDATAVRIFRTVRRMTAGDRQLASDVTQDSFLVMWQRWPQRQRFSHDDNRKYVRGIAAHKVADWYRAQRKFVESNEELAVYSI